jgi:hypothetical protein
VIDVFGEVVHRRLQTDLGGKVGYRIHSGEGAIPTGGLANVSLDPIHPGIAGGHLVEHQRLVAGLSQLTDDV